MQCVQALYWLRQFYGQSTSPDNNSLKPLAFILQTPLNRVPLPVNATASENHSRRHDRHIKDGQEVSPIFQKDHR